MTTESTATEVNYVLLGGALRSLVQRYNRHRAWLDLCDELTAWRDAGLANAEYHLMEGKRPPSKDYKHQMYGDAGRILAILGDTGNRPSTLDEIGAVIDRARKAMQDRPRPA